MPAPGRAAARSPAGAAAPRRARRPLSRPSATPGGSYTPPDYTPPPTTSLRFEDDLSGASKRGTRDGGWGAPGGAGSSSDGEGDDRRRRGRVEVPFAIITLADELWALTLETDVSTPAGAAALAAALVSTLPPPGRGSAGRAPPGSGARAAGRAALREVESLGERDIIAILRRVGRRAGAPAALALRDFLAATGAGYPLDTPAAAAGLMHVAALNGDATVADAVRARVAGAGGALDGDAWSHAAQAYGKARRTGDALAALAAAEAVDGVADAVSYTVVLAALERDGTRAAAATARQIYDRALAAGLRASSFHQRALIGLLTRSGDVEGAAALVRQWGARGRLIAPSVASQLAAGAAARREWPTALDAARMLAAPGAAFDAVAASRAAQEALRVAGAATALPADGAAALEMMTILRPRYANLWATDRWAGVPSTGVGAAAARGGGPPTSPAGPGRLSRAAEVTDDPDAMEMVAAWIEADGASLSPRPAARLAAGLLRHGRVDRAVALIQTAVSNGAPAQFGELADLAKGGGAAGVAEAVAALAPWASSTRDEAAAPLRRAGGGVSASSGGGAGASYDDVPLEWDAEPRGGGGGGGGWSPPPQAPVGPPPPPLAPTRSATELETAAGRLAAAARAGTLARPDGVAALAAIQTDAAALPPGVGRAAVEAALEAAAAALGVVAKRAVPAAGRGRGRGRPPGRAAALAGPPPRL